MKADGPKIDRRVVVLGIVAVGMTGTRSVVAAPASSGCDPDLGDLSRLGEIVREAAGMTRIFGIPASRRTEAPDLREALRIQSRRAELVPYTISASTGAYRVDRGALPALKQALSSADGARRFAFGAAMRLNEGSPSDVENTGSLKEIEMTDVSPANLAALVQKRIGSDKPVERTSFGNISEKQRLQGIIHSARARIPHMAHVPTTVVFLRNQIAESEAALAALGPDDYGGTYIPQRTPANLADLDALHREAQKGVDWLLALSPNARIISLSQVTESADYHSFVAVDSSTGEVRVVSLTARKFTGGGVASGGY